MTNRTRRKEQKTRKMKQNKEEKGDAITENNRSTWPPHQYTNTIVTLKIQQQQKAKAALTYISLPVCLLACLPTCVPGRERESTDSVNGRLGQT